MIDKSKREDGTFSREDFTFYKEGNVYVCPAFKILTTTGKIMNDDMLFYRASKADCDACLFKRRCCPKEPSRKLLRSIHEEARDVARAIARTEAFEQSCRDRKRVEMLFAHLKRILRLGRLRLRGARRSVRVHAGSPRPEPASPCQARRQTAATGGNACCVSVERVSALRRSRCSIGASGNQRLPEALLGSQHSAGRPLLQHGVIPGSSHPWAWESALKEERGRRVSTSQRRRASMETYVGLDVSLRRTSICVVDQTGKVLSEGTVNSTPEAIVEFVKLKAAGAVRIGLETGPTSTWLWTSIKALGLPVICIDARHAKAVLKMQINKSDRNDAFGLRGLCSAAGTRKFVSKALIVTRCVRFWRAVPCWSR